MLARLRSGALHGATRFDLPAGTGYFPREIFELADSLEILDISNNGLSELPADFARLTRLRVLFSSNNHFTCLPEVLGACPQLTLVGFKSNRIDSVPAASLPAALRWLILTDNRIAELPASLAQCRGLRKLALAGNRLMAVPEELQACRELELLRISANEVSEIPPWLSRLPRLAWLAYAGNPITAARERAALAQHGLEPVAWSDLLVGEQLGAGASGVISRAVRHDGRVPVAMALKLFKAGVTSDGYPQSELAASVSAGRHAELITAEATLSGHPQGAEGLILPLVGAGFRVLAEPPSLESCTRDVYSADVSFTAGSALRLARGVAAAMAHLHARGILHGDLYAHNLLHDGGGDCRLGDFGAATLYGREDPAAVALQRVDVRAFGCLLEEIGLRTVDAGVAERLAVVRERCCAEAVGDRPGFIDLLAELALFA